MSNDIIQHCITTRNEKCLMSPLHNNAIMAYGRGAPNRPACKTNLFKPSFDDYSGLRFCQDKPPTETYVDAGVILRIREQSLVVFRVQIKMVTIFASFKLKQERRLALIQSFYCSDLSKIKANVQDLLNFYNWFLTVSAYKSLTI